MRIYELVPLYSRILFANSRGAIDHSFELSQYMEDETENIFALNLTSYRAGEPISAEESGAASETDLDDDVFNMTTIDHLRRNRRNLSLKFPFRKLMELLSLIGASLIMVKASTFSAFSELYASYLRHTYMNPSWYREDGRLRDAPLDDFVRVCVNDRRDDAASNDAMWARVRDDPRVQFAMRSFLDRKDLESDVVLWFKATMIRITDRFGVPGGCSLCPRATFGLGGALAYTDPVSGQYVGGAAYLSQLDGCYLKGSTGTPFAGIEFKYCGDTDNERWFAINSSLPQTLCALSGHSDCVAGLMVCDKGFAVIYRRRLPQPTPDGHPLYQYFQYPPRTARPQNSPVALLCYCLSPNRNVVDKGSQGRMDLLRVMYEIARTSFVAEDSITPVNRELKNRNNADNSFPKETPEQPSLSKRAKQADGPTTFGVQPMSGPVEYLTAFDAAPYLISGTISQRE